MLFRNFSLALFFGVSLILSSCAGEKLQPVAVAPVEPTLEEKIGQMLMVGFRGLSVADGAPVLRDIREYHLGGVILFDRDVASGSPQRNFASPGQIRDLITALQQAASVPLLVAVDQEGGRVSRLKEPQGFPRSLSARFLGDRNDPQLTRRETEFLASALAAAGINFNLAPVVDLSINPDNPVIAKLERSFSSDPQVVAQQAQAFIDAHHERGVLCAIKHFPGHGSSRDDSHLGLVDVSETWTDVELEPYRQLFAAGSVDAVMTAHIYNRQLDPRYPATLSRSVITGLLRGALGYDGVVISDDLQMGAIRAEYSWPETVQAAIGAGVDILLIANNTQFDQDIVPKTVALIQTLVQEGKVSTLRIDESYRRIMQLKSRLK